jgi:hypothetical protein
MIDWQSLYKKLLVDKKCLQGERHHIIPKHDGGTDLDGIVILERRYHILAHYIRWRWKKQAGDKIAYKIMKGQIINPMLDPESKKYIMDIIDNMSKDPEYIKYKSDELTKLWKEEEYRNKTTLGRKRWIETNNNRFKLAERVNTPEVKKKVSISLKKYYSTISRDIIKERSLKAQETINKKYTKEEIKQWKSLPGEKNPMFGKGHLISGDKSGMWNGYKYIVEKSDGSKLEFIGISKICNDLGISAVTVSKYVNTDNIINRGKLKGCKVFSIKIK